MSAVGVRARGFGQRHVGRQEWALRDVTFTIEPGTRLLLLGASGSGKSTLLRALAGLVGPSADSQGWIEVAGEDARSPQARHHTGLLMQDPEAHLVLPRVVDDIAFALRNRGVDPQDAKTRAHAAMEQVGLCVPGNQRVDALSGGEKQRVALAGVLALQPGLLLLDEPTSMLDAAGAARLRSAVTTHVEREATTVVVVEHRTRLWEDLVDRVIVLEDGRVVADATPAILRDASWRRAGVWVSSPTDEAVTPPSVPTDAEALETGHDLAWRFKGTQHDVLHGVDVEVREGEGLAVRGRNGSGKSSLLNLLGGLRAPSAGRVVAQPRLRGDLRSDDPASWSSRALAGRIGTVFQNPEHGFVTDSVTAEIGVARATNADVDIEHLLEVMRLDHVRDANPFTLSGGQQRRLSVAAALACRPQLLLLDEPTYGQDPVTWDELVALLRNEQANGMGVILATHDDDVADAVCHKVLHTDEP